MSETVKERFEREIEGLRGVRDELQVRLHLGKLDAKEQWEGLEKKWNHVEAKLKQLESATEATADELGEAARLFVEEVREGYDRLRNLL